MPKVIETYRKTGSRVMKTILLPIPDDTNYLLILWLPLVHITESGRTAAASRTIS